MVASLKAAIRTRVAVHALLILVVLFPFVPSIVPSSDTQPTFLAVFVVSVAMGLLLPRESQPYRLSLLGVTTVTLVALVLYAWLVVANATQHQGSLPARLIAFAQFVAAIIWARSGNFTIDEKMLLRALQIYAAFTVVYFLTQGAIEDVLIRSRLEGSGDLLASGRGARTLSPEPAFFAVHVFNIFVLSRLVAASDSRLMDARVQRWILWLTVFCLAASLSAYGALLLVVVLFVTHPRLMTAVTAGIAVFAGAVLVALPNWDSIRAIKIIAAIVQTRGNIAELMLLDRSVWARATSFSEYVRSFTEHPFFGDGFSLYQMGGFVSVVAAFGVIALLFFVFVAKAIAFGKWRLSTRVLALGWFGLHFAAGPIGIPILGAIIGYILKHRHAGSAERQATRAPELAPAT
jgi:O-antigen ligase